MTLIARFELGDQLFYVGDLLITSPTFPGEPIRTPLSEDINSLLVPHNAQRSVTKLVQKVNLINDRLVVAWADDPWQARAFLKDVVALSQKPNFNVVAIQKLIAELPHGDKRDLSLLGTHLTWENKEVWANSFHMNVGDAPDLHDMAAGTGATAFKKTLAAIRKTKPLASGTPSQWARSLVVAADLIGNEITSGHNILEAWGGGIEIVGYEKEKGAFKKLGDILHTFWITEAQEKEAQLYLVPKFVKYDYIDDLLVIQKYDYKPLPSNEMEARDIRPFFVPPLYKSANDYDLRNLKLPSIKSSHFCCYVMHPTIKRAAMNVSYFNNAPFILEPESNKVTVRFRNDLIASLCKGMADAIRKPVKFVGLKGN